MSLLTDLDLHLFGEGTHYRLYNKLGAHYVKTPVEGVHFAVWAPNAREVSVIGDFNSWNATSNRMSAGANGLWQTFVKGLKPGEIYKYRVVGPDGAAYEKTDPFAFAAEVRPRTAAVVYDIETYTWSDERWMTKRRQGNPLRKPMSIYEVHLGSWMRVPEEGNRWMTYRELADKLSAYCADLGYTHIELLPITEHPLDSSWGYQTVGFFAPSSRFGTPDDFMYFVDRMHQAGIGVILDWVPSHFPKDGHGLGLFDGTHLYEHADPRQGEHKEWGTYVFNYGRYEVQSFLISNALFWLDKYHIDGLRVDAVASMLYLDYGRRDGAWVANRYGGNENLEAVAFVRRMSEVIYSEHPDVMTIAEESTAWPNVSKPTYIGGLGFGFKWDMGWMHDTLLYMSKDPVHRKYHHNNLTFRALYSFSENFVLPLSHDEVVYGKRSLLNKMPGDMWQKFANLRLLFGYMYAMPGKKLVFMGGEFGQFNEWQFDQSLDWHLLQQADHKGVQRFTRDLNKAYSMQTALHELDCESGGFEWIDCQDYEQCILSFIRKDACGHAILVVCNFTPVPRHNYVVGVPQGGYWKELINSDATAYGGSGVGNFGGVWATNRPAHGRAESIELNLPPLGVLMMKPGQPDK